MSISEYVAGYPALFGELPYARENVTAILHKDSFELDEMKCYQPFFGVVITRWVVYSEFCRVAADEPSLQAPEWVERIHSTAVGLLQIDAVKAEVDRYTFAAVDFTLHLSKVHRAKLFAMGRLFLSTPAYYNELRVSVYQGMMCLLPIMRYGYRINAEKFAYDHSALFSDVLDPIDTIDLLQNGERLTEQEVAQCAKMTVDVILRKGIVDWVYPQMGDLEDFALEAVVSKTVSDFYTHEVYRELVGRLERDYSALLDETSPEERLCLVLFFGVDTRLLPDMQNLYQSGLEYARKVVRLEGES